MGIISKFLTKKFGYVLCTLKSGSTLQNCHKTRKEGLEGQNVDGNVIIWILEKQDVRAWTDILLFKRSIGCSE
jgi:hypothetical protein